MKTILVSILISLSASGFGQEIPVNPNATDPKGLRQGKWTIWFDQLGAPINDPKKIDLYRVLEYKDDKPIGTVRDYHLSGIPQWEGSLLADRPQDVVDYSKPFHFYKVTGEIDSIQDKQELGTVYYMQGKYTLAMPLLEEVLVDTKKLYGERQEYVRALNSRAYFLAIDLKFPERAEELYLESIKIQTKLFGKDNPDYATSIEGLAELNKKLGYYDKARTYFLEAIEIRRKVLGRNHPDYVISLSGLSQLYLVLGNFQKAEQLMMEEREIKTSLFGKDSREYSACLNNLAALYQDMGYYEKAEPIFLEAIEINKKITGKFSRSIATSIDNLAGLYQELGNYSKAESLYLEAKEAREKKLGNKHLDYALSLDHLAGLNSALGNYKQAKAFYLEAIEIQAALLGKRHLVYAGSINGLASLYENMGEYAKAEPLFIESKDIRAAVLGKGKMVYAASLNNLALLYGKLGNYSKAAPLLQEALEINAKVLGKDHPAYLITLVNLAMIYNYLGDYSKAKLYLLEATKTNIKQIDSYFPYLSDFEKEKFYKKNRTIFQILNAFAMTFGNEDPELTKYVYDYQLATKGILLNASSKWKQFIRKSNDKDLLALYANWEDNVSRIAKIFVDGSAGKELDSLKETVNVQEKELSKHLQINLAVGKNQRYSWDEIKGKLGPDEVAIEMIRIKKLGIREIVTDSSNVSYTQYKLRGITDSVYYAALLVTKKSTSPEWVILKNGNDLETRFIGFYRNSIQNQLEDGESYNQFWKSIADRLNKLFPNRSGRIIHIFFSPDGVYHELNLNTLYNPATGKYLLDESNISLVTSTKDLLTKGKRGAVRNVACLLGFPDYDLSAESRSKLIKKERDRRLDYYTQPLVRGGDLSELPGTKTEVESIGNLMTLKGWQAQVLIGDYATEENVKDCVSPRVLHIATHGYFRSGKNGREDPMLESGLMLAGASQSIKGNVNDKTEDGILTSFEAMNLNLDNTDLVVLSACETGLGDVHNGEGVYGLQRAFKVAGANTIIMSLWKVNDEATQELMTSFYGKWLSTNDKRQAFNFAQQKLKAQYSSPYYWGAFVMVGE